ncbi:unnamed protein product [Closterium sp. NIES-54]
MYINLYFIVTRLLDYVRAVRDHFLVLEPTDLTDDLLEKHLIAAETSIFTVGAARGTHCTPFFEGCSPSPLAPSYTSAAAAAAAAVDILGAKDVGATSALSGNATAPRVVVVAAGVVVVEAVEAVEVAEVVAVVGVVVGVGASVAAVVATVGVAAVPAVGVVGAAVVAVGVELFRGEVMAVARDSSSSVRERPLCLSSFTCGKFHSQHRCFSCLENVWCAEFGDEAERPRWAELLRSGVDIFALDNDAILAAMYGFSVSAEGHCYLCVPTDPGIEAAALGASESALLGSTPVEALHTFTLDSGASRCFFRDSTTLTPLPALVLIRLAYPSGGQVLARSSTVLPCPAIPSGSLSGLHLPSFSTNLVSTSALQDAMVTTTTPEVHLQLCERFCEDLPVLRLHFDRGGELISDLLRDFFMEVARTSMIHAAAPHLRWPFVVRYAAHQLNLWPRVSLPETLPTLCWTGKVGDVSVFRVWGSRAFVRDTSADKLSSRAIPCVFLGFPPDAPCW